jgi:Nif-specific regulatory protein
MPSTIDVKKFNTLIEINNLINSDYSDITMLLTQILESAVRVCGEEAAALLFHNRETGELFFEIVLGMTGLKQYTLKAGEGVAGWVAEHNKPLIVNNVQEDKRYRVDVFKHIPCKNMMAVPLRVKDECIGVIELINQEKDFTQDELEWLEIFSNQAGIAFQAARSMAREDIRLLQDELYTEDGYHTVIAKSPVILEKLELIDRIAKTDSSVLILGESGVGKEIFAEQIHLRSLRNGEPFVRVNCAALPEGLLESELFGHIKGAFTHAVGNRRGRFEMADGGTIFLDEIGDLPLSLQAKLLRVIQEKTFEKVGSDISQRVNVRILAATNKDIDGLVKTGEFRSDLYYRLNVLPLYIPPLRQRPEDIPELAAFFLKKCIRTIKKQFDGFSGEAMDAMLSYSWPGNVRELENCIERACVIGNPPRIQKEVLFLNDKTPVPEYGGEGSRTLKTAINLFKTHFIQEKLKENHWNQTETAKALDIQRTYLSRLIKELNITNPKEH